MPRCLGTERATEGAAGRSPKAASETRRHKRAHGVSIALAIGGRYGQGRSQASNLRMFTAKPPSK